MGKPVRKSKSSEARPTTALLDLAEALAQEALMLPANERRYRRAASTPRAKPAILGRWEEKSATARLMTKPGTDQLTLEIRHPSFEVDLLTGFDCDDGSLIEPIVTLMTGDRKRMSRVVNAWLETMNDFDEDMIDAIMNLGDVLNLAGDSEDTEDEPSEDAEPPAPSTSDRRDVRRMAAAYAGGLRGKSQAAIVPEKDRALLALRPQLLWPILDGAIEASSTNADPATRQAWRELLGLQLTNLRYDIDRGLSWATRWVGECQSRLIAASADGRLDAEAFGHLTSAFGEARIVLSEQAKQELADAALPGHSDGGPGDIDVGMRAALDQMAQSVDDPFVIIESLSDMARVVPSEVGQFVTHEFAFSTHQVLREAVPLQLLSRDQSTRRAAAAALERIATPNTLSPTSLRRMIANRNWIPPADRPMLDQAIRKARRNEVPCAQWAPAVEARMLATTIDGSGAASLLFLSKGTGRGQIGGVLFKLGSGVADAWHEADVPRTSLRDMARHLIEEADASDVDRPFMDRIIQHAIARSVAVGAPPAVALLRVAEMVGAADWQDRRIDAATEAAALFDALPADDRSEIGITASLQRSALWVLRERFAETWYLDDPDSRKAVAATRRLTMAKAVERLVVDLMPTYRAEWAERMVLLALRAASAHDPAQHGMTRDFVIAAHMLTGTRPITEIPLMQSIAMQTVRFGRTGR